MQEATSRAAHTTRLASTRIVSLDQFRGYTVLGMFVVNFLGCFAVIPAILKHHNTYCSYADTIMPQFFFAVGFAYRLTFLSRAATLGRRSVYGHFIRRILKLILLGALLYVGGSAVELWLRPEPVQWSRFFVHAIRTNLFQALVHIGVTSLWIMPVIAAPAATRIGFAVVSAVVQLGLSHWFYYDWVMAWGIDGGPLGFLTWTVPTLAGSLAYDIVIDRRRRGCEKMGTGSEPARANPEKRASGEAPVPIFSQPQSAGVWRLAFWGGVLMVLGYGLSCLNLVTPPNAAAYGQIGSWLVEPPLVPPTRPANLWTMNQRAGSISYLTFGAGFSMALLAVFVWACDVHGFQVGFLRTFGANALAGYVIHIVVDLVMKPFTPRDSSLGFVLAALALFLAVCYFGVRRVENKGKK